MTPFNIYVIHILFVLMFDSVKSLIHFIFPFLFYDVGDEKKNHFS